MSAADVTSYALAAIGLVLLGWEMVAVFRVRINVAVANAQLVKLAKAGNLDRVRKLAAVAPGTYFDAVRAAVTAIPADSRDRVVIATAMERAFDEAAGPLARSFAKRVELGWLGAIVVAGGVALALSGPGGASPTLTVAGGFAVLGALWLFANHKHVVSAVELARREVLPEIADAAAGGATLAS